MQLKKEISGASSILLIVPGTKYNEIAVDVARELSGKKVCYATLNKTYDSLKEILHKNKVDTKNFSFIDAISRTIKNTPDHVDNCWFVTSPGALTELSIAIEKHLQEKKDYFIFDSITNLMIYQKKDAVTKFISSLINQLGTYKAKAIFYAVEIKEQEDLIQETCMFVEKVVNMAK